MNEFIRLAEITQSVKQERRHDNCVHLPCVLGNN